MAAAVLCVLPACGDAGGRVAQQPPPSPSPTASPAASPNAGPTMLTCGVGGPFPPATLDEPADAEKGTGGAADALRAWLANPDNEQFAKGGGWRELVSNDREAVYAQGTRTPPGITVRFERRDGAWKWASSASECDLRVLPPAGHGSAQWVPATPVEPADTTFVATVHERGCASGRSPEGRVAPPRVEYTATAVVVTFFVRPPEGELHTCQGAPGAPYEVVLPEPLGDRKLLDGGVYPPRPPRSPYVQ